MSASKKQFDSTIGGDKILPYSLNVMEFISSRAQEIAALSEAIDNPQRTILVSQRLPKHMQRRIMSHNPKRLPTSLRQAAIEMSEKAGGTPNESKRPRRKYRRRPRNLLNEYNRRQRMFVWLETHLWHAKRFHMTNKWSYRLPDHPNDKSYRACYRATTQHCLLEDLSYYIPIEISGKFENVINSLSKLTSPECGLTFGAKYYLNGSREGSTLIYHKEQYPYGVIGRANFLWRPPFTDCINNDESLENKHRCLWIWTHPSYFEEFFDEITNVFDLIVTEADESNISKMDVDENIKKTDQVGSNIINDRNRVKKYVSKLFLDITVINLKDSINRLRLTGPLAQSIITDAFILLDPTGVKNLQLHSESTVDRFTNSDDWIKDYYRGDELKINSLKCKQEIWLKLQNISDHNQLPNNMVLPLIIRDPRFNLPVKRTKVLSDNKDIEEQPIVNPLDIQLLNDCPFWEIAIRDKATENKLSTGKLTELQSKLLIPGTIKDLTKNYDIKHYLPVILIQHSSYQSRLTNNERAGNGWDIILPAGWSMPVWLSLVWRGARVGGLREHASTLREADVMCPIFPDSNCGLVEDNENKNTILHNYFKKPPAKRPNYKKLGVVAPFSYPWKEILRDWNCLSDVPSSFFVLRDKKKLEKINLLIKTINNSSNKNGCNDLNKVTDDLNISNFLEMNNNDIANALIGISVKCHDRGKINEHSIVCLPLKEDLDMFIKNNSKNKIVYERPFETPHNDPSTKERIDRRKQHLAFLKKMKKKRKKFKDEEDFENLKLFKNMSKQMIESEQSIMKDLWLPDLKTINVKDSCSRKVMGFVVAGAYSLNKSCSSGQSYITLTSLFDLLKNQSQVSSSNFKFNKPLVLVRTTTSLQYSFAGFKLAVCSYL